MLSNIISGFRRTTTLLATTLALIAAPGCDEHTEVNGVILDAEGIEVVREGQDEGGQAPGSQDGVGGFQVQEQEAEAASPCRLIEKENVSETISHLYCNGKLISTTTCPKDGGECTTVTHTQ